MAAETKVVIPKTPNKPESTRRCTVKEVGEGLEVTFLVDPDIAKRIKSRAGTMPLYRYMWENVLNRAVTDHVF